MQVYKLAQLTLKYPYFSSNICRVQALPQMATFSEDCISSLPFIKFASSVHLLQTDYFINLHFSPLRSQSITDTAS